MKKLRTDQKESNTLLRDFMERLLYGLVTLVFFLIPFLISGGEIREGSVIFIGEVMLLLFGIIVFSIVSDKKTMRRSRKRRRD